MAITKPNIPQSETRPGAKGLVLEELLKAYFTQAGYFVLRGLSYRVESDDITDIDLWLYERPSATSRRRIIVDIKNKRTPKASERIIWAKGLQIALGVDGCIVATTDKRSSSRRLARSMGVTLFDGDAIAKLAQSDSLKKFQQLSADQIEAAIKKVDLARRSTDWRQFTRDVRSAILSRIGAQSANLSLSSCGYFADQAILAHANSEPAQIAIRMFYQCGSLAAISFDYMLSDQAFQSSEDKREMLIASIRYGQSDAVGWPSSVRTAVAFARKYIDNGTAKRIENAFFEEANAIPAEIVADHVTKISNSEILFTVARELERASTLFELPSFDNLSSDARSLLGVFLDFYSVDRAKLAEAWVGSGFKHSAPNLPGPLFG